MSRTKYAAELHVLLVEEIYGELTSRIFSLLLRRGRLTIPALAQYTRMPSRHLRHGLVVLIQQNLVYFHFDSDSRLTHYEANDHASYFLLRSGKVLELVRLRYGPVAQNIVQSLSFLGHAKIGDLVKAYDSRRNPSEVQINGNGISQSYSNGVQNNPRGHAEDISSDKLEDVLSRLLDAGLVKPVVQSMFQSPSDTYNQVEKEILHDQFAGSTKGAKQKEELKSKIIDKLKDIRSGHQSWHRTGTKRALNGGHINGWEKRRKLVNGDSYGACESNSHSIECSRLDRNLVIGINYEKFTVLLRTQKLISLAAREIGEPTSRVYGELLRLLEDRISRCQIDPIIDDADEVGDGPPVTTLEIVRALEKLINTTTGIERTSNDGVETNNLEISPKKRKRKLDDDKPAAEGDPSSGEEEEEGDDGDRQEESVGIELDFDSHGDDPFADPFTVPPRVKPPTRPTKVTFQDKLPQPVAGEEQLNRNTEVRDHLLLLAEHSSSFVYKCGSGNLGEWTVDFGGLAEYMKETELDTIIAQRFGRNGKRIAQILRQKGKLEEKQIQKYGLFKLKDVRTKLVEMQMAGFVDIQELPKDSKHTPQHTMFLWYFDTERVMTIVLENIYKAMSRCLQLLNSEKREQIEVLSMVERTDVRGHEEEFLIPDQLKALYKIREKEEKVLAQVSRLDELVGIFQDF